MKRYELLTKEEIIDIFVSCHIGNMTGTEICSKVSYIECVERHHFCAICAANYLKEEVDEKEIKK